MEKYCNDAIIGNKNLIASYTKNGELLRMYYPTTDFRQYFEFFHTGVKINDSRLIYLHNDINNIYEQYYTEETNILNTDITNTYFNLRIVQTDFVPIEKDVLIKKYKFINNNNINLSVKFLIHSKLLTDDNNDISGYFKDNCLVQYGHDFSVFITSKEEIENVQINNSVNNIETGIIGGKDYIGMSKDSSISYNIGKLKPGEEKEIDVYIYVEKKVKEHKDLNKIDAKNEYEKTKDYWMKYLKEHNTLKLKNPLNKYEEKIKQIYERTILLFPLLINHETGGISAGVEVDETKRKCGRYSYCWPRDAIFITEAFDILKMEKETEKFYKVFCKQTQEQNGMWEQRFYTDGNLAPCWGYQIDETASVVYGIYSHYKKTKNKNFLKENLKMCEKAISYLKIYLDNIFKEKEMIKSYDIWEENEGIHAYSLATIFSAIEAQNKIYDEINDLICKNRIKQEKIVKEREENNEILVKLKEYITDNFYDKELKTFVRNKQDKKIDISLLGLTTPFNIYSNKEKKIENTIEKINLTLRTYTGGYLRYENDNYMGGNPWVISNLWMANYYIEKGEIAKAKECLEFVVKTSTKHGYLGEQVNNETMQPAWVIGLGWSHALFAIVISKLY